MCNGVFGYYQIFSGSLVQRYLTKLDSRLDHWEIHFLRRGYDFLSRGMTEGAISALNYLELPAERRQAVFAWPMEVVPMTDQEAGEIRRGLGRIAAQAEAAVLAIPHPANDSSLRRHG